MLKAPNISDLITTRTSSSSTVHEDNRMEILAVSDPTAKRKKVEVNVSTHNTFDVLRQEDNYVNDNKIIVEKPKDKIERIPPIIIIGKSRINIISSAPVRN